MSRNKAIMGENGFAGHFYWTGDDSNQVPNITVLLDRQLWKKEKMQHDEDDPSSMRS